MGVYVHEHKASGFILTLNEKLTNYSSNLINMQTDICYLGVNSRGIFLGGGALMFMSLLSLWLLGGSCLGITPPPGPGASSSRTPTPNLQEKE